MNWVPDQATTDSVLRRHLSEYQKADIYPRSAILPRSAVQL